MEARKFDDGKLRWHLFPWSAAKEVVRVLMFGAEKYGAWNWTKGMDWTRPYDAAVRHMNAWLAGETHDPETGINHLAHAACNMLFLLSYSLTGTGRDDRQQPEND